MDEFESLSHSKWECKYHVVFITKFGRKVVYGKLRNIWGKFSESSRNSVKAGWKRGT